MIRTAPLETTTAAGLRLGVDPHMLRDAAHAAMLAGWEWPHLEGRPGHGAYKAPPMAWTTILSAWKRHELVEGAEVYQAPVAAVQPVERAVRQPKKCKRCNGMMWQDQVQEEGTWRPVWTCSVCSMDEVTE